MREHPKWLYGKELERLEHLGKHSEAEITLACDDDGWRYGYSFQLHDKFITYRGHSTPTTPKDSPLDTRQDAISAAAKQIKRLLEKRSYASDNPKAVSQVISWLDHLAAPATGQLRLFTEWA